MLIAAHKAAELPSSDFYLPVHVGHSLNPVDLGYQPDDTGKNISALNGAYCELTALYWAWHNLDAEVIGLSHYRRYFRGNGQGPRGSRILSEADAQRILSKFDVLVARRRNYVVETVESHYRNGHHGGDLDILRAVIDDKSPEFIPAYDQVLAGRSLSLYNMFVARRELFQDYASWLFPILEETSIRLGDVSRRTRYQQRTIGYLGERLLNVWLGAQTELKVARVPVVNVDGEPKVRKAAKLIARKVGVANALSRTS